jgi:hypothetical protein
MAPSIFGFEVASELPLDRLVDAPAPRGRVSVVRAGEGLLDVEGELLSWWQAGEGPDWVALARTDEGFAGECSQSGAFTIHPGRAEVRVRPRDGAGEVWQHRVTATLLPLLVAAMGDLVLHAAAVVTPGGAVVFCGPSGRGKSTLALQLSRAGHPVLAEDGVAIELGEGRPVAWPGPHGIRVADDAGAPKHVRPVPESLQVTDPAPLLAAVALAPRTAGEPALERLDAVTAARALVTSTISSPGPGFASAFGQCARLAERVPVFRMRMPEGLARAEAAGPELLAAVARVPA